MNIPPAPPGWNKTIADLSAEMKKGIRKSFGSPEVEWARDYERSLLPKDIRFPKQGDIYEAIEDVPVHYMTAWRAPFTGGGDGQLKKGERVVIKDKPIDSRPIGVYAEAANYASLEERIVPSAERNDPKYAGFYFSFKTLELNRKFRLVSE
jgi:hypothetical protein